MFVLKQLYYTFKKKKIFHNKPLCLVSGGPDSILLLFILLQYYKKIDVVYCHHFWQEQNFLSFWQLWKLGFLFKFSYTIILAEHTCSNETTAKIWRYESSTRLASLLNTSIVYTGHTGTDKVETFFLQFFRGLSPTGLFESFQNKPVQYRNEITLFFSQDLMQFLPPIGFGSENKSLQFIFQSQISNSSLLFSYSHSIVPKPIKAMSEITTGCFQFPKSQTTFLYQFRQQKKYQNGQLVRPLTSISRYKVFQIFRTFFLPVVIDSTNTSLRFKRNRIRYQLLPLLTYFFTQKIQKRILQYIDSNDELLQYNNSQISKEFDKILYQKNRQNYFLKLPKYCQMKFVHILYKRYTNRSLTTQQLDELMSVVNRTIH